MGIDLGHFVKQKHIAWNSKIKKKYGIQQELFQK